MDPDRLIEMANRIALFFESMPDHAEALDGVANHVRKFWEPRMRRQLLEIAAGTGGASLRPLAREAVAALQAG